MRSPSSSARPITVSWIRFKASETAQRALVLVLACWGAALILPEFARVASNYGTLGFEANNDGVVMSVSGAPATDPAADLQPGDCIDLQRTHLADRLAVFGSMGGMSYVRPDLQVTLYVAHGSCDDVATRATRRVLVARQGPMTLGNRLALLADQILGVFFIGLAAILVWQRPNAMTWGFFLYAIWFNPGQWFVAYAELERHWYWLVPQQVLQAVAQAFGYAGFVSFALRFPNNRVETRWRPVEKMLPALVLLLIVLQLLSFGTIAGYRTETVSRWFYWTGYGIDLAVLLILRFRRKSQSPEDRQRTLWVHWGCRIGLIAFIFADSNMATNAWAPIWNAVCPLGIGEVICTEGSVSETFLLVCYMLNAMVAIAVFHAVRHHRVIDVRLALSRGATLLVTSFFIAALLAVASVPVEHFLHESFAGQIFVYIPVVAGLKMTFDHLHTWMNEWCDRLFFKRLHNAERKLDDIVASLYDAPNGQAVDRVLVADVPTALGLASAALFPLASDMPRCAAQAGTGWPTGATAEVPLREALLRRLLRVQQPVMLQPSDIHPSMPGGSAQPVIALPVLQTGVLRCVVLYGARTAGDRPTDEELHLLSRLVTAAGSAYERAEKLALREKISELQAATSGRSPA